MTQETARQTVSGVKQGEFGRGAVFNLTGFAISLMAGDGVTRIRTFDVDGCVGKIDSQKVDVAYGLPIGPVVIGAVPVLPKWLADHHPAPPIVVSPEHVQYIRNHPNWYLGAVFTPHGDSNADGTYEIRYFDLVKPETRQGMFIQETR